MSTAGASLARLASELVDLRMPVRVDPGTVILTFRNGAPLKVLEPGSVHRRIVGGLPGMGRLKGMTLSTADIPMSVTVSDVALQGVYPLESVTVSLRVRLHSSGGYSGLMDYAGRKGINFPELLDAELYADVSQRVRAALGSYAAEEVRTGRKGLNAEAFGNAPLLDGLFSLEKVLFSEPAYHPGFLRERDVLMAANEERVRKEAEIQQASLDHLLDEVRDHLAIARADRRGMTLAELENPEMINQALQRDHEVRLGLIDKLDEIRRAGGSEAVEQIVGALIGPMASARPGASQLAPSASAAEALLGSSDELDRLRADAGLDELWQAEHLPGHPLGLGQAGTVVVVVAREDMDATLEGRIGDLYRQRVQATEVHVIDAVASLDDLVSRYFSLAMPDVAALLAGISTRVVGERLTILLSSESQRLSPVTQRLNDPAGADLAPLLRVLPHETVDVRPASAA